MRLNVPCSKSTSWRRNPEVRTSLLHNSSRFWKCRLYFHTKALSSTILVQRNLLTEVVVTARVRWFLFNTKYINASTTLRVKSSTFLQRTFSTVFDIVKYELFAQKKSLKPLYSTNWWLSFLMDSQQRVIYNNYTANSKKLVKIFFLILRKIILFLEKLSCF